MKRLLFLLSWLIVAVPAIMLISPALIPAQELKPIKLLEPQLDRGKILMRALKERHSTREYVEKKVSLQDLSNLLWAAWGISRKEMDISRPELPYSYYRTAPSGHNWQEIDLYVVTAEGVYFYDAIENMLNPILEGDIRFLAGTQQFVSMVPVNLIYVFNPSRKPGGASEGNIRSAYATTGAMCENVYLYCASEGLACVMRGMVDKPALSKAMKLGADQMIIVGQTVGYAKE